MCPYHLSVEPVSREAPPSDGPDRADLMPLPGESVDAYVLRLRALRSELTALIAAAERGVQARPGSASATPVVTVAAGRAGAEQPEPLPPPLPVPGLGGRPRADPPDHRVSVPLRPARQASGPTASAARRETERRVGASDRRNDQRDQRRGSGTAAARDGTWWLLQIVAWGGLLLIVLAVLISR